MKRISKKLVLRHLFVEAYEKGYISLNLTISGFTKVFKPSPKYFHSLVKRELVHMVGRQYHGKMMLILYLTDKGKKWLRVA